MLAGLVPSWVDVIDEPRPVHTGPRAGRYMDGPPAYETTARLAHAARGPVLKHP